MMKLPSVTGTPANFLTTLVVKREVSRFLFYQIRKERAGGRTLADAVEVAVHRLKYWVGEINSITATQAEVEEFMIGENDWLEDIHPF